MRGHTLMQAIARVNRVFRDKPGGLVVDYLGIANDLRQALREYTQSGAKGEPVSDVAERALPKLIEQVEVARGMMHGFDYSDFETEGYELLAETLARYHNRAVETAQVIEELIAMAKQFNEAARRGKDLKLDDSELAFLDAFQTNEASRQGTGR